MPGYLAAINPTSQFKLSLQNRRRPKYAYNSSQENTCLPVFDFCVQFDFLFLILSSGSLHPYSFGIMWCPGVAAILTQLIFYGRLRGLGWRVGKLKYWLWSYGLPVLYGGVVYGIVWLTGLGKLVPFERVYQVAEQLNFEVRSPVIFLIIYILGMGTIGVAINMTSALGEEIGWRGLLVPELYREFSFAKAAFFSGIIWAVWHSPVILFADYNNTGVSTWYGLTCFVVMVIGMSFAFAWLRLNRAACERQLYCMPATTFLFRVFSRH